MSSVFNRRSSTGSSFRGCFNNGKPHLDSSEYIRNKSAITQYENIALANNKGKLNTLNGKVKWKNILWNPGAQYQGINIDLNDKNYGKLQNVSSFETRLNLAIGRSLSAPCCPFNGSNSCCIFLSESLKNQLAISFKEWGDNLCGGILNLAPNWSIWTIPRMVSWMPDQLCLPWNILERPDGANSKYVRVDAGEKLFVYPCNPFKPDISSALPVLSSAIIAEDFYPNCQIEAPCTGPTNFQFQLAGKDLSKPVAAETQHFDQDPWNLAFHYPPVHGEISGNIWYSVNCDCSINFPAPYHNKIIHYPDGSANMQDGNWCPYNWCLYASPGISGNLCFNGSLGDVSPCTTETDCSGGKFGWPGGICIDLNRNIPFPKAWKDLKARIDPKDWSGNQIAQRYLDPFYDKNCIHSSCVGPSANTADISGWGFEMDINTEDHKPSIFSITGYDGNELNGVHNNFTIPFYIDGESYNFFIDSKSDNNRYIVIDWAWSCVMTGNEEEPHSSTTLQYGPYGPYVQNQNQKTLNGVWKNPLTYIMGKIYIDMSGNQIWNVGQIPTFIGDKTNPTNPVNRVRWLIFHLGYENYIDASGHDLSAVNVAGDDLTDDKFFAFISIGKRSAAKNSLQLWWGSYQLWKDVGCTWGPQNPYPDNFCTDTSYNIKAWNQEGGSIILEFIIYKNYANGVNACVVDSLFPVDADGMGAITYCLSSSMDISCCARMCLGCDTGCGNCAGGSNCSATKCISNCIIEDCSCCLPTDCSGSTGAIPCAAMHCIAKDGSGIDCSATSVPGVSGEVWTQNSSGTYSCPKCSDLSKCHIDTWKCWYPSNKYHLYFDKKDYPYGGWIKFRGWKSSIHMEGACCPKPFRNAASDVSGGGWGSWTECFPIQVKGVGSGEANMLQWASSLYGNDLCFTPFECVHSESCQQGNAGGPGGGNEAYRLYDVGNWAINPKNLKGALYWLLYPLGDVGDGQHYYAPDKTLNEFAWWWWWYNQEETWIAGGQSNWGFDYPFQIPTPAPGLNLGRPLTTKDNYLKNNNGFRLTNIQFIAPYPEAIRGWSSGHHIKDKVPNNIGISGAEGLVGFYSECSN